MSIITFFKRWRYWIHDIMTNDGLVYKQYREIRKVNGSSGTAFCEKQLTLLKAYACEHVPFYRNLSTAAGFPIVNKNHYTSCPDAFVSDEYLVAVKEGGGACKLDIGLNRHSTQGISEQGDEGKEYS